MKYLLCALILSLSVPAFAGRSNAARVFVRDVQCLILESNPEQYEGIAHLTFRSSGNQVRMRFARGTSADIYNTCVQLRNAEGTTVTAIYNFDATPPTGAPTRVIHGFTHFQHAHIIDGTIFGPIALAAGMAEPVEDFVTETGEN